MNAKNFKLLLLIISLILINSETVLSQIDYTDLIPDQKINIPDTVGINFYFLDLNSDGFIDYKFSCSRYYTSELSHEPETNLVIVICDSTSTNTINPGPFAEGDTIQPSPKFQTNVCLTGWMPAAGGVIGSWYDPLYEYDSFAYLGLAFSINQNIHYGWMRLKTDGFSVTIDDFAWNENTNEFIIAGQTE